MPFTDLDRQAGRKAMEESLDPLTRALRKFTAGKPSGSLKDTPLGVVSLAVDQRDRLMKILSDEPGIRHPRITEAAIVGRLKIKGSGTIVNEIVPVVEGKESAAVEHLEGNRNFEHQFTISGLVFAVHVGKDARLFSYRIERTPLGDAVLKAEGELLLSRRKEKQR